MAVNRASFGDLLEPGMRKIFFDNYNMIPQKYQQIFNVLTSNKQDETDSSVSGFGQFDQIDEAAPLTYEDPVQGYDVVYVHKAFKKGFKVSEEMWEDDQYNIMKRMPKNLGISANRTVENKASLILNTSANTTYATGGDGVALASTAHPRADGGANQSNYSTGAGSALAETAVKSTRLAMRKTLDDKGQLIVVIPDRIIVPPELDEPAQILIKSIGRTATTNINELNPYEDMFEVIVWDYLGVANNGSATQWYMQDKKISELNFFWRRMLNFGQDESFSTDEALFKAKMRFSVGFSNWRGFYVNAGV